MKNALIHPPTRRHARGTSLIEVLVSILILSIGLLAMAGIHASAMRDGKTNQFKVSASEVTLMLGDAIKVNPAAQISGAAGSEKMETAGGYVVSGDGGDLTKPTQLCATVCTPAAIAALDVYYARLAARMSLPSGDISTAVVNDTTSSPALAVWVHWVKPNSDNNESAADQALWETTRDQCPAAVKALTPPRQCLMQIIPF